MSRTSSRWRLPDGGQEDTGCREAGAGSSRFATALRGDTAPTTRRMAAMAASKLPPTG